MFRQDLDLRVFRVSLRRRGEQLLVEITIVSREERGKEKRRVCVRSSLVQSDDARAWRKFASTSRRSFVVVWCWRDGSISTKGVKLGTQHPFLLPLLALFHPSSKSHSIFYYFSLSFLTEVDRYKLLSLLRIYDYRRSLNIILQSFVARDWRTMIHYRSLSTTSFTVILFEFFSNESNKLIRIYPRKEDDPGYKKMETSCCLVNVPKIELTERLLTLASLWLSLSLQSWKMAVCNLTESLHIEWPHRRGSVV